jgi:peroxiredoxin Q/BCP
MRQTEGVSALLATLTMAVATATVAGAQEPGSAGNPQAGRALTAPAVGDAAPDFALPSAGEHGASGTVRLGDYKGKVVVVAFSPGDKTTGCTAELSKFRDEEPTLFGRDVIVLPISTDGLESHANWASEMHFPFALLSDTAQTVATLYGSTLAGKPYDNRTVFVIGRDGRIAYRELRFGALNENAYAALAQAIAVAKGH